MLLVGTIKHNGIKYLYSWIGNRTNRRWVLYTELTADDTVRQFEGKAPKDVVLEPYLLKGNQNFPKHIVAVSKLSKNNSKLEHFGDTKLLGDFMDTYRKVIRDEDAVNKYNANIQTDMKAGTYLTAFTADGFQMETVDTSEKTVSIKALSVDMIKYNELDFKNKAFAESMKANSYKTLKELMMQKDLKFCIDYSTMKLIRDYRIINTQEEFEAVLTELGKEEVQYVALDTETTGLNINSLPKGHQKKDRIVGMSLTWRLNQAIYIPFDHTEFPNMDKPETLAKLMPILAKKKLITHNGMFDGKVLYDEGYKINISEDTQLLAFHINPKIGKGNTALKSLTYRRYGDETLELDDIFPRKDDAGLFRYLPEDLVRIYACCDTDYTYRLLFDMIAELKTINSKQVKVYKLDCMVASYLYVDEYYGNNLDTDLLVRHNDANNEDLETLEKLMYKYVAQIGLVTQESKSLQAKGLTEEQIKSKLDEIVTNPEFDTLTVPFSVTSPKELNNAVFNMLDYPVTRVSEKTGEPSIDKFALKDLLREKVDEPNNWLKEDVKSALADSGIKGLDEEDLTLIRADEFRFAKFPFAVLLSKYRDLDKLRSGFFQGLIDKNTDGLYHTGYRLTNADTARIINPVQTLKGALKKLVVEYHKDYYMFVFDFAAIEYRVMMALAKYQEIIDKLNDPEADYHREVGASMMGTTPEDMTSKERGDIKSVNFAVPYGMGPFSLGQNLARGRKEAFGRAHVEEAKLLLAKWQKANVKLYITLEAYRKVAVEEGVCQNPWGRRKYFETEDLTNKQIGDIKRQAGNYPIQSLARELFATAYVRLKKRLEKEGHLTVREDTGLPGVMIPNLVHDEMVSQVHKSIHPYQMYQWILEECMLELEGHPTYYAGMNVVDNWYQGKDDMYEAPIRFVWEKVEQFKNGEIKELCEEQTRQALENELNYTDVVLGDIEDYMYKRYQLELKKLQPDFGERKEQDKVVLDLTEIIPKYKDYFLKPKMAKYIKTKRKANKKSEDIFYACFESLALDIYEELYVIYPDGIEKVISNPNGNELQTKVPDYMAGETLGEPHQKVIEEADDNDDLEFDIFGDNDAFEFVLREEMYAEETAFSLSEYSDSDDVTRAVARDYVVMEDKKFNYNEEAFGTDATLAEKLGLNTEEYELDVLTAVMIEDTEGSINFLLTAYKIETVKKLIMYLKSKVSNLDGNNVKLVLMDGTLDLPFKVKDLDKEYIRTILVDGQLIGNI